MADMMYDLFGDVRSFLVLTVVRSFSLEEARGLKSRVLLEAQWRLL